MPFQSEDLDRILLVQALFLLVSLVIFAFRIDLDYFQHISSLRHLDTAYRLLAHFQYLQIKSQYCRFRALESLSSSHLQLQHVDCRDWLGRFSSEWEDEKSLWYVLFLSQQDQSRKWDHMLLEQVREPIALAFSGFNPFQLLIGTHLRKLGYFSRPFRDYSFPLLDSPAWSIYWL